jgi:aminomethyltransferase
MSLRKTPLFERHEARGARFTEFGGWNMPVEYESITTEHETVREAAGKFDVSHMGQVRVRGTDAERLLQWLTTNDVTALEPGDSHYSMITDDAGVILDDTIVYCLRNEDYLFIPNAGHDDQMTDRWMTHRDRWDLEATVDNVTEDFAMIAVQGPDAIGLVNREAGESIKRLARFELMETAIEGVDCRRVSRSSGSPGSS